jgi:hypothetical protein
MSFSFLKSVLVKHKMSTNATVTAGVLEISVSGDLRRAHDEGAPNVSCDLTDDDCELVALLTDIHTLKIINMTIKEDQLQVILYAVKTNTGIRRLWLTDNVLARGFEENTYNQLLVTCVEELRDHPSLRELTLMAQGHMYPALTKRLWRAIRHLPALRVAQFVKFGIDREESLNLIRESRTIREFLPVPMFGNHDPYFVELQSAIAQNWSLRLPLAQICSYCGSFDPVYAGHICATSDALRRNYSMAEDKVHRFVLDKCLALAPLRLPAYVILWILDWLPPLHHRFEYRGNLSYDPRHMLKIRLIESLTRSYRTLRP